ncbi:MAG: DUF2155 domain-containing protein [Alphaproteobacteria bacterium]|nr:MAG: DUF2155 domain-containing protein [Alphaproteobacteria bacterium]
MKNIFLFLAALAALLSFAVAAVAEPYPLARMQVLDKVTTQRQAISIPIGKSVTVGTLHIVVRACYASEEGEKPEQSAFIEIYDAKAQSATKPIFSGWMFKSSPSVSALEHPIYDVTVLGCGNADNNKS